MSDPRSMNFPRIAIFCIYALVAAEGASHVFSFENRSIDNISSIGFVIFASIWAVKDSKLQNINFYYPLRLVYLVTCPTSTVVYLIYTCGWWGLGLVAINLVAINVFSNMAYYCMYYIVYVSGFWELYDPIHFEN